MCWGQVAGTDRDVQGQPPDVPTNLTATLPTNHPSTQQGLVDAVGVSNYGPKQLQKISAYLDKRKVPLAAVQVQYSLLRCACIWWG